MFGTTPIRSFAILAAVGATLAAAAPAGAVIYNGHAGLGASFQHNQTDLEFLALSPQAPGSEGVTDGTSNTIMVGERARAPRGFSIDVGTSENLASDGLGADAIGMADMGGQFS